MEQRKLSDQANTLVDLSKVRQAQVTGMSYSDARARAHARTHSSVFVLTCALVWLSVS